MYNFILHLSALEIIGSLKNSNHTFQNDWTQIGFQHNPQHHHKYNKHYFCNKFKTATGETYLQYLNNLRVFHACKMLKKGHALTEICEKCGFENMSYFIQLFKKIVGTTPKQYALDVQKR